MQAFTLAGTTALVALLGSTALAQETRTFDVSLPLGAESHHAVGVLKFGEELARLSEGRLTIRPHYDNALGAEREVVEGMGLGLIDMGITSTGPMGGFAEPFLLFDLPYIFAIMHMLMGFWTARRGTNWHRPCRTPPASRSWAGWKTDFVTRRTVFAPSTRSPICEA